MDKLTKHGVLKGCSKTKKLPKIYVAWSMMKQRCFNKKHVGYKRYGGRGITVCDKWLKFENFYNDMNESMERHIKKHGIKNTSLDRVNNDRGYSKKNCAWATRKEQANNMRANVKIQIGETKQNACKIINDYNISRSTLNGYKEQYNNDELLAALTIKKNTKNRVVKIESINGRRFFKKYITKLTALTAKRQMILLYRYGIKTGFTRTLPEAARHFGITKQRVSQICMEYKKIVSK